MLDRVDIFNQLQTILVQPRSSQSLFEQVLAVWHKAHLEGESFRDVVTSKQWPFPVPQWFEPLQITHDVASFDSAYGIIGVDGSQIYPDRFYSNADCFVINTGGIEVSYKKPTSQVSFFSQPYVYTLRDVLKRYGYDASASKDLIDLIREEFEFKDGLIRALAFREKEKDLPFLCLFDGSFVFWHLEGKPQDIKELFLSTYMLYLRKFQEQHIPLASYISLPRNRELCNALRILMCERYVDQQVFCFADQACACKVLQEFSDIDIIAQFVKSGQRTGIFMSRSSIADYYFDELKPCFFFLNTGEEIGRVELPWWLAKDKKYVDFVAQIIFDQAHKGLGYPMVLAEAHEQAVIKHHDKLFFYELLEKLYKQQNTIHRVAAKNLRKRRMPA
ncbi:DNA double-strand break repair nuclease NurA [Candidatus Dependentiae bacterium]|nr:DNA double-strand break repair nuclease NurA [Candidatus Dependentiae bacterium]